MDEANLVWSNKKVFSNVIMDIDDPKVLDGQTFMWYLMALNKSLKDKEAFFCTFAG